MIRDPDDTDTDSTDDDEDVGGLGKFSHGSYGLVHRHWVKEVISAGSFAVHNTEAAEANHKICMRLASVRVRHLHAAKTKSYMLKYLCWNDLFGEMVKDSETPPTTRVLFHRGVGACLTTVHMRAQNLLSTAYQKQFLHKEALITRGELLDLLCDRFGVNRGRASYRKFQCLQWTFGQKLTRQDGTVLWATDSQYPYGVTRRRRDVLRVHGTEVVNGCLNALCCEAVLFVTVSGVDNFVRLARASVPARNASANDITFVLGRWFSPHPSAGNLRDTKH